MSKRRGSSGGLRVRDRNYMVTGTPMHRDAFTEKKIVSNKLKFYKERFTDDPAVSFRLYMAACSSDGRLLSSEAIKNTLRFWVNAHRDNRELAVKQCRDWIEANRHLFRGK